MSVGYQCRDIIGIGIWIYKYRKLCLWWRHQMETFSALLAFCAGNSPVTGEFPAQSPVTRSFDLLICVWINGWVNNHEAGDLRCYHTHYDVTVMCYTFIYVWMYFFIPYDGMGVGLGVVEVGVILLLIKTKILRKLEKTVFWECNSIPRIWIPSQCKDHLSSYGDFQYEDCLIFKLGIPILVRTHLYIETALRSLLCNYCCIKIGMKAQKSFHQLWIMTVKLFLKWASHRFGLTKPIFSVLLFTPFFRIIKTLVTYLIPCPYFMCVIIIPPEVERRVYWSHIVHLSIRRYVCTYIPPFVRTSVCRWTELCPLCIFKNIW